MKQPLEKFLRQRASSPEEVRRHPDARVRVPDKGIRLMLGNYRWIAVLATLIYGHAAKTRGNFLSLFF
jgi:hypothetical protein